MCIAGALVKPSGPSALCLDMHLRCPLAQMRGSHLHIRLQHIAVVVPQEHAPTSINSAHPQMHLLWTLLAFSTRNFRPLYK